MGKCFTKAVPRLCVVDKSCPKSYSLNVAGGGFVQHFLKRHIVFFSLIPVLGIMVMIFLFSSQNGEESGELSARITETILRLVYSDYDLLTGPEQALLFERISHIIRKTAHFTEFAALGFFLLGHFKALASRKNLTHPFLGTVLSGFLYAISDEFHQSFVNGRSPSILDVGIDSAGVLFGLLVMALLLSLLSHRQNSTEIEK